MKSNILSQAILEERRYALENGGYLGIREADDAYNDINIKIVSAMKKRYGRAFIGSINFSGAERIDVCAGRMSVFKEYYGQRLYTGCCQFCVPEKDQVLEVLIRRFNDEGSKVDTKQIFDRIEELNGEPIHWV